MPELIARGAAPNDRWRRRLREGESVQLGRTANPCAVPWDDHVSRIHAELVWRSPKLLVQRQPEATNAIFVQGNQLDRFEISVGQHFVIGSTTFTLVDEPVDVTLDVPQPMAEQSYSPQYLKQVQYKDADRRIAVLSQLPEVISSASDNVELFLRIVNIMLSGIGRASVVAIVSHDETLPEGEQLNVLHWDRRLLTGQPFHPSKRLISKSLETGESVLHTWQESRAGEGVAYTQSEDGDWAFATPMRSKACKGWVIYVTGHYGSRLGGSPGSDASPTDLRDDIKFSELVAAAVANTSQVKMLERTQAGLRQFFSPVILDVLADQDPEVVLAPRETEVSVLFCDLQGFSRTSEQQSDHLLELLDRVSQALGVATHQILAQGGVVGDFHGDASMGFWGWPLNTGNSVVSACSAALGIRRELINASTTDEHPLKDFSMGMGIATGKAVAGKIGTLDQVKVTVFGPVVNLASRLESMTRILHAPILLDERSADLVRQSVSSQVARTRRVAVVRPYGMDSPLEVTELLPPPSDSELLNNDHITAYESALEALLARDWEEAFQLLHRVPADDHVKDFLTVYIAQHNRRAPEDWDGVIDLRQK